MGSHLHLIRPLGFDLSEKALRRAGLDYWPRLAPTVHDNWDAYLRRTRRSSPHARRWLFTTRPRRHADGRVRTIFDATLARGDHLVFGAETRGLPAPVLDAEPEQTVCFPMVPEERSLNLATAVCSALTEGIRQAQRDGWIKFGEDGRIC